MANGGDVVELMKRVPVVEREANKFFRVLGFMAGDDSVMKCVEEIVIELE